MLSVPIPELPAYDVAKDEKLSREDEGVVAIAKLRGGKEAEKKPAVAKAESPKSKQ